MHLLSRLLLAAILSASLGGLGWAADCPEPSLEIVSTPVPPQLDRSMLLHRQQMFTAHSADLVLLGDSMFARWEDASVRLGIASVANFGVGSDTIQNVRWRLQEIATRIEPPKAVAIWAGSNNLILQMEPCAMVAGIVGLVNDVQRTWPNSAVVVVGVTARGSRLNDREDNRRSLNAQVKLAQKGAQFRFFDPSDRLACPLTSAAPPPAIADLVQPATCPYYSRDNIHLSPLGYRVVADGLRAALPWLLNAPTD